MHKVHFAMLVLGAAWPLAYMAETVDTILVKGEDGKALRINADSFDEDKHTKFRENDETRELQAAPISTAGTVTPLADGLTMPPAPSAPNALGGDVAVPSVPSPNARLVTKEGKKFVVVGPDGVKLTDEGLAGAGYATEAEAWNAIAALPH